jgi:hypothetical protein
MLRRLGELLLHVLHSPGQRSSIPPQPSEAAPQVDLWEVLRDLCSMRSAHSNAFLDRSACARSSRAARLGRRPHAKQEHRRPAQDADLRIELHADCTVDACQCAHQPPLNAAAAAPQSSRGAFRPLWSRPATRFSRTPSPRARRIRAVQGWFRHSIGQVCILAHCPARCCSEHCIGGRIAI